MFVISGFVIGFVCLCISCDTNPGAPEILFSETFENGYDNTWDIGTHHTVTFPLLTSLTGGMPSASGTYACSLYNVNTVTDPLAQAVHCDLVSMSPQFIRFYVRAGQTGHLGAYIVFWEAGSPGTPGIYVSIAGNDYFFANSTQVTAQGAITANTWYKVELRRISFTDHTYDLYIDDVLVCPGQGFSATTNALSAVELYNWDADTQFYFDDILVY